jgi:hypothetical protein
VTRKARRWGRSVGTGDVSAAPAETGLSRATVVDATVVNDEAARAWLEAAGDDVVAEAVRWLNFSLRAHRAAAADPGVLDVVAEHALAIRAGYGEGFEVADGTWSAARDLTASERGGGSRRARREATLRPQERLAALLSGRDAVLACEELALRARTDLVNERPREAALQAHIALEAAVAELQAFSGERMVAERLPDLERHRAALAAAANEALHSGPSDESMAAVEAGLRAVEAALRARVAGARY